VLQNILSALGMQKSIDQPGLWSIGQSTRLQSYMKYKRLYDGYAVRASSANTLQYKRLKYNPSRPIVNIAASFLAGCDVTWTVSNPDGSPNEEASKKAVEIWQESGGAATFMSNAIHGTIYGDTVLFVTKEDEETAVLRWTDPLICWPTFDPHDYNKIKSLTIAYEIPGPTGKPVPYKEVWADGEVKVYVDDKLDDTYEYDEERFDGPPAVWIRNQDIKSEMFGRSDLQPIDELVEEYDHVCCKQTRIIDYYANPNIAVIGATRKESQQSKSERTMYYLPEGADMKFITWEGTPPAVDTHIDRIRETIAEQSETPQIAFSKIDSGITNVSGIALKILFGPLLRKTARKWQSWGPALEKAMWMALMAEGFDLDKDMVTIEHSEPTPENLVEFWQTATEKEQLGVSKKQILREAGYTADQITQMEEEKKKEQEELGAQLLSQFSSGKVSGLPYGQDTNPPKQDQKAEAPTPNKGQ